MFSTAILEQSRGFTFRKRIDAIDTSNRLSACLVDRSRIDRALDVGGIHIAQFAHHRQDERDVAIEGPCADPGAAGGSWRVAIDVTCIWIATVKTPADAVKA